MIYQTYLPCQSPTETFLVVKRGRKRSRTSSSQMIKLLCWVNGRENQILGTLRFVKTMCLKSADNTQTLNFSKYCTKNLLWLEGTKKERCFLKMGSCQRTREDLVDAVGADKNINKNVNKN